MIAINGMNVVNSYVGRYFMSAIARRDMDQYVYYAWMYAAVFLGSTALAVFFRYCEETIGLLWRSWMTKRIIAVYLNRQMYLRENQDNFLTNPDQRISEDVRSLTVTTLSFVLMILNSTITIISFCGVLWAISPMLLLISFLYAVFGSIVTILLGRKLIKLNYQQSDFEADFRSELIRIRDNGREISQNEKPEELRGGLNQRIDNLVQNLTRIFLVNRRLGFFTTGYNYFIQILPIIIVAPIFIKNNVDFGIISQSAMAFATIVGALSLIVTQFQSISGYAAVVTRLTELIDATEMSPESPSAA